MGDDVPAETTYSSRQVAERMGISGGMLRRYAMALERVVGKNIRLDPRDGRQYTGEQVVVLMQAKQEVAARRGLDVETAIRLALGESVPDTPLLSPAVGPSRGFDLEAAKTALGPFLTEMQALRRSNERVLEYLETEARADRQAMQALQENNERLEREVAALRSDLAARALPVETSTAAAKGLETQRKEQELWLDEVLREEFVDASESPEAALEGRGGIGPGGGPRASEGSPDGLLVRAARWLEGLLGR